MKQSKFTFIDLFAGIGGFRLAMEDLGGKCVFSSEIDKYAQKTYESNFGEAPAGDITIYDEESIPDHDILAAGFPCQAFSIAGHRKGIDDTRGTLFFDIARILKAKKPKAFILENVKGLKGHKRNGISTLDLILSTLRGEKDSDINYWVPEPKILNAKNFGVPQNRERIVIVGFRRDLDVSEFDYPKEKKTSVSFQDVMESNEVSVKYYLSDVYLDTLKEHKRRHKAKGNGFGYQVIEPDEIANAIVVGGMGKERNLIYDPRLTDRKPVTNIKGEVNNEDIRRMTPREWARLQGFPDSYSFDAVSDTQAYKQLGNSVPVPMIKAVAKKVVKKL